MPVYNKLIRDKIPKIITENGQRATIKTLSDDEFVKELEKKLQEEVAEYLLDKTADELVDILEVVYTLGVQLDYTPESLERLRMEKAQARGGFSEKLLLMSVDDNFSK